MFNQYLPEFIQQLILSFIIVCLTFILASWVKRAFDRIFTQIKKSDSDYTNYAFLRYFIIAGVYIVGFGLAIYMIPKLRSIGGTLLAGAGVFALAISFASQQALSNIVSGLFIVIFKPFRIGDRLQLQDQSLSGKVEDITLRHTVIRDFEQRRIIVPNTVISDQIIINSDYSDDYICKHIDVSISYESDLKGAKAIMASLCAAHDLSIKSKEDPTSNVHADDVLVRLVSLAESSVNLRAWVWAKNFDEAFILSCDLLEQIKEQFDQKGIEIPYPHRTVIQKNNM